ncbi:MAG: T9SS type A sorting domain-containing protein [Candidatus Latescibacteria bacterium]|nr:T9SS type A sorting domain-containing protein [Candidatus Latescibacterota bacterium]
MYALLPLILCALLLVPDVHPIMAQDISTYSGHHYSWVEGARIGHDFGRNPWSPGGQGTEGFVSPGGRAALRQALAKAVEAGEQRLSFDFGFDFRSIVQRNEDNTLALDPFVMPSIEIFLAELDSSHAQAQTRGRSLGADVVLTDFRIADNQPADPEHPEVGGDTPAFILDPQARQELVAALAPALARLGQHPRIALNLMNEPEFLAFPAAKALDHIRQGQWPAVNYVERRTGKVVVTSGAEVLPLLEALGPEGHVRVQRDQRTGAAKLSSTPARVADVDQFLIALREGITLAAPQAQITVGWADDQSAIENTLRLEKKAGHPLTEVLSFHVYDVPINPWHPLKTTRADFVKAGLGDRQLRITEWGLGSPQGQEALQEAIAAVFSQVQQAGFEGVLFWWDADHLFGYTAYQQAIAPYASPTAVAAGQSPTPGQTTLGPAYPNPFNAGTHLPYQLAAPGPVRLRIYNLAGQLVDELVDQWQTAGAHHTAWSGEGVASGIYLYELQAGEFKLRRQMMLIK